MVVTMMAARNHAIEKYIAEHPGTSEFDAMSKLVCYVSNQVRFRPEAFFTFFRSWF